MVRPIKFSKKEWGQAVVTTALALASFRQNDPLVFIPLLTLSALTFLYLVYHHEGAWLKKIPLCVAVLLILGLIAYRQSRTPERLVGYISSISFSSLNDHTPVIILNVSIKSIVEDTVADTFGLTASLPDGTSIVGQQVDTPEGIVLVYPQAKETLHTKDDIQQKTGVTPIKKGTQVTGRALFVMRSLDPKWNGSTCCQTVPDKTLFTLTFKDAWERQYSTTLLLRKSFPMAFGAIPGIDRDVMSSKQVQQIDITQVLDNRKESGSFRSLFVVSLPGGMILPRLIFKLKAPSLLSATITPQIGSGAGVPIIVGVTGGEAKQELTQATNSYLIDVRFKNRNKLLIYYDCPGLYCQSVTH